MNTISQEQTLITLREDAGHTQESAATAAGITHSTLSRIETGETQKLDTQVAMALADAYSTDVPTLARLHQQAVRAARP